MRRITRIIDVTLMLGLLLCSLASAQSTPIFGGVSRGAVASVALPTVNSLTLNGMAADISVSSGTNVTIAWTSSDGTSWTLNGAAKTASGSQIDTETVTISYTFTVTNSAGSASLTRTVTVTGGAASGCGAYLTNPADNSTLAKTALDQCDPTTSTVDESTWTSITVNSLPITLVSGTNYTLNTDLGNCSDTFHLAFKPVSNTRFDMNGHTICGVVAKNDTGVSGWEMFDSKGTGVLKAVVCYGCSIDGLALWPISVYYHVNQTCPAVGNKLHDFTIQDLTSASSQGSQGFFSDSGTGSQCAQNRYEIYRVKIAGGTTPSASRTSMIYVQNAGNWSFHGNHIIPAPGASASQGISMATAPYVNILNNWFDFPCNTVAAGGNNFRAIDPDGNAFWAQDGGGDGSHDVDIEYNYASICNNMFLRPRNSHTNVKALHNYVDNIQPSGNFGGWGILLGNPDVHNDDLTGMSIQYNKFVLKPGGFVYQFNALYNMSNIGSNYINCDSGGCAGAYVGQVLQNGSPKTGLTFTQYLNTVNVESDVIDPGIVGIFLPLPGGGTGNVLWSVQNQGTHSYTVSNCLRSGNLVVLKINAYDGANDTGSDGHSAGPAGGQTIAVSGMTGNCSALNTASAVVSRPTVKATATATASGGVLSTCTPNANGALYATAPTATVSGGTGGAVTIGIDSTGAVNSCTVTSGGSGYTNPTVSIAQPHVVTYTLAGSDVASTTSSGSVTWPDVTNFKACNGASAVSVGIPASPTGTAPNISGCP